MGVFDFVKDAGASVGIGKSTKEEAAGKAKAKAQADLAAANKAAIAEKRSAAAAAKRKATAQAKVKAAKARSSAAAEKERAMEEAKAAKLTEYVEGLGLKARGLSIGFDDGVATIKGTVADRATKERMVLAVGNVEGVSRVKESLKLAPSRPAAKPATVAARKAAKSRQRKAAAAQTMHRVKSGDTLSKLSQKYLGDASRYMEIFNANKPMLTDPDMIQVGQTLRIPRK